MVEPTEPWRGATSSPARTCWSAGSASGAAGSTTSATAHPRRSTTCRRRACASAGAGCGGCCGRPGEQTSTCELLSYDARGVRSYQRYDAIRDPHDVRWFDGALHVSSSWDDAVWRIELGADEPTLVWQGSTVPDAWHVNSLVVVDSALHVCAFGRFDRHKAWKGDGQDGVGFVRDLRAGRDVLTGLSHPHTPRWRDGRWYVCESTKGSLTELDADGTVRRRAAVRRFTRGPGLRRPVRPRGWQRAPRARRGPGRGGGRRPAHLRGGRAHRHAVPRGVRDRRRRPRGAPRRGRGVRRQRLPGHGAAPGAAPARPTASPRHPRRRSSS